MAKKTAAAAAAAPAPAPAIELPPPPPVGSFEMVDRLRIQRSSWNPRRHFDQAALEELAASIRTHGLIEPLVVRRNEGPASTMLELVAGERRLRAAQLAELHEVPVVIRELTDEQAFDIAIGENAQRRDLHPLEEAEAFAVKRDRFHRTIEEIATQVGKSRQYVATRLKLTELCQEARAAFLEGKIESAAIALLVARIPDEKLQREAVKAITSWNGGEGMTYAEARHHVHGEYMLELGSAPFSIADAALVAVAGACTTCPKRTGNQRELFEDVDKADVCTDPACYRTKVDAEWRRRTTAAKEEGVEIIAQADAKKLFYSEYSNEPSGSEWTALDRTCYDDTAGRQRTYRQLLGGKKAKPDAIVRNPHSGAIVELLRAKGLKKRLRDAGHDLDAERKAKHGATKDIVDKDTARWKEERARLDRERAVTERLDDLVVARAVAEASAARENRELSLVLVRLAAMSLDDIERFERVLKRRGIAVAGKESEDELAKKLLAHAEPLSAGLLRGLLLELLYELVPGWGQDPQGRKLLLEYFELDEKELRKEAAAAVKAAEKEQPEPAKKKGRKAAASEEE